MESEIGRGGMGIVCKRDRAEAHLASYQELVAQCQSPRFTREAERLAKLFRSRGATNA